MSPKLLYGGIIMNTSLFDKAFKATVKWCTKHSVQISAVAVAVGIGTTVYTTSRTTLKVNSIIHRDDTDKKTKVKESVKASVPTIASVAFTYISLAAMYRFGKKKETALLGILASTQQLFQTYRDKNRKEIGSDAEAEKFAEAVVETKGLDKNLPAIITPEDEFTFCDSVTGQFFDAKLSDVYKAMYIINRDFQLKDEVEFNDWLDILGCDYDETLAGMGWERYVGETVFGYTWIDFNIVERKSCVDSNGRRYMLITYPFLPHVLPNAYYNDDDEVYEDIVTPLVNTDLWKNMTQVQKDELRDKAIAQTSIA